MPLKDELMTEGRLSSRAPVLIIGADGLIGRGLADAFAAGGATIYRTTRRTTKHNADLHLDLTDPALDRIHLPNAGVAVFCAATNGFANCRLDQKKAFQTNVKATEILSRRLTATGCRVIYLSSSAVFDFSKPRVPAMTPQCPSTIYGQFKMLAERQVLSLGSSATVVRLTKVLSSEWSRFSGWLNTLSLGGQVSAYSDLHFAPISLDFIVYALMLIIAKGGEGIYQVSGADDISYAGALRHLVHKMGLPESRIIASCAAANGIPPEEIATFTSLDTSRFEALAGDPAPTPYEVLDQVYSSIAHRLPA
jgi:dTDP-4-dehydrorhamnose reductase